MRSIRRMQAARGHTAMWARLEAAAVAAPHVLRTATVRNALIRLLSLARERFTGFFRRPRFLLFPPTFQE